MIDSIDFRISDDSKQVEIGLFHGEECRNVLPLTIEKAKALRAALDDAIAAVTSGEKHGT